MKITIYIPTKNRVALLKKAVKSVLEQTYENWELIVVNDASTDGTKEYLDTLAASNHKIKAIHHRESHGACVSRNDAIFSASGEYITGLDDDDEFTNDRLEKFISNWDFDERIIALCAYKNLVIDGKKIPAANTKAIYITREDLLYKNTVGNQIFIKTEKLRQIGGFDEDFKMWQDYSCWYKLLSAGGIIKKIPFATYNWDHSDRDDRITQFNKDKTIATYNLFVRKFALNFRNANILKFTLVDYHLRQNNWAFYFEILLGTLFDRRAIEKINNEFLKPKVYNVFKRLKLIK